MTACASFPDVAQDGGVDLRRDAEVGCCRRAKTASAEGISPRVRARPIRCGGRLGHAQAMFHGDGASGAVAYPDQGRHAPARRRHRPHQRVDPELEVRGLRRRRPDRPSEGNSVARMDIDVAQSAFTAEPFGGIGDTHNRETATALRHAQGNSTMDFRLFSTAEGSSSPPFPSPTHGAGARSGPGNPGSTTGGLADRCRGAPQRPPPRSQGRWVLLLTPRPRGTPPGTGRCRRGCGRRRRCRRG